ncbi:FAD-dependent oxidoreductase [Haloechinothrix sp. YIM 98757]|uniref:FAD-dependent oxidoreductase n=1 Tax=Haloechinothrix aidingensis TaxID=2752311 RepID=A0A838A443_9PSEU|nr:FAD-dependent oxidoreductase [Haloechinothrix aidingensis]
MHVDLAVLGAGPAGLAAAWRAARQGHSVAVLERAGDVGGMAASFTVDGVRVDHGSHRLHPSIDKRILGDLHELLGDDLQRRQRNGRLRVAGRWVGFPLRPVELARSLPPGMIAKVARDAAGAPLRRDRDPRDYAAALRAGLGPTLYEALYSPYAVKLWGLPGEEIDPEQARRRVTADTPVKIAKRMLRVRRGTGQGRIFYYPRRGFGQIVEALADAAVAAGVTLRCATEVTGIDTGDDRVELTTAGGERVSAGQLFSTIPLPVLGRITRPAPDETALESTTRLEFRSMVLVYLTHDGARPWTEFDAHYLPQQGTPVTRISEPANYRDSSQDPHDRTVLCAEIPCDAGDSLWNASDERLAALVDDAVTGCGLPPLRTAGVHVRRLRHVYPIYRTGYRDHLAGVDAWADTLPRVTTFGRLGLFAHDNTHHALTMAYDAVAALRGNAARGDSFDADSWHAARRRFANHVVED